MHVILQDTARKESVGFRLLTFFFFFCLFVWVFLCFQALDLSSVYKMFPLFNVLRLLEFFYYYYNFQTAVSPNSSAFSAQPSLLLPATPARAFVQNKGLLLKTA